MCMVGLVARQMGYSSDEALVSCCNTLHCLYIVQWIDHIDDIGHVQPYFAHCQVSRPTLFPLVVMSTKQRMLKKNNHWLPFWREIYHFHGALSL